MGLCMSIGLYMAVLLSPIGMKAQTSPEPAGQVVKEACKEAASAHKKVFLLFHASWCGWCHRMDNIMGDSACKDLFDQYYVIRHLTILESKDKKDQENPGALELYTKYTGGGQDQGIPFFLIIDGDGTVLADSRAKPDGALPGSSGNNVGCPSEPGEVAYFVKVLHRTSGLSAGQLDVVSKQFSKKQ